MQGTTDLAELVAPAERAQADEHAQPRGLPPSTAAAGKEGSVATASIFTKGISHTQPLGGSLSTPSVWSSASMNVINLGDLGNGGKTKESNTGNIREPAVTGGAAMSEKEKLIYKVMEEMECSREDAVEIVGGEEEEEEEFEVVQVVLIKGSLP